MSLQKERFTPALSPTSILPPNDPTEREPTYFFRDNRELCAVLLETQAWFCARDLGRLMGLSAIERAIAKFDPDQFRTLSLNRYGQIEPTLMLSESGTYRLLNTYFQPENRHLRFWLSTEVLPMLRNAQLPRDTEQPYLSRLHWPELDVCLLYWQSEPWIKLSDVPRVLLEPVDAKPQCESTHWRQRILARCAAWWG